MQPRLHALYRYTKMWTSLYTVYIVIEPNPYFAPI